VEEKSGHIGAVISQKGERKPQQNNNGYARGGKKGQTRKRGGKKPTGEKYDSENNGRKDELPI